MQFAGTVPAFDLRISIEDTEPLIWRRLLVPEALSVEQFHLVVQAAFGWENRHLYGVQATDRRGKKRTITDPADTPHDLGAEAPSGVVLSELVDPAKPGSAFDYDYDFGDNWTHRVELLGAAELSGDDLVCLDGANRGPLEDSGGPFGYRRLMEVLADQTHPEYPDARSWVFQMTGEFRPFDPTAFDPAAASQRLHMLSLQWWPQPLTEEERDEVLRPLLWFLQAASGEGLELTKDAYLKPALVKRAVQELGWAGKIVGAGNRENQTPAISELRQQLLDWRLLQKRKGRLLPAPRGRRHAERPDELWDFMVDTLALPEHPGVYVVTQLYADWLLGGVAPPLNIRAEVLRNELAAAGMVTRSGDPIPEAWAADIDSTVRRTLNCLHLLLDRDMFSEGRLLSDGGVKFLLQVQDVAARHVPAGLRLR